MSLFYGLAIYFFEQLAVLTTNLPVAWDSSIFLRVDETRVDVIKALITGPEGTPYVQLDLIPHLDLILFVPFLEDITTGGS
jgi:hypothetical protein